MKKMSDEAQRLLEVMVDSFGLGADDELIWREIFVPT